MRRARFAAVLVGVTALAGLAQADGVIPVSKRLTFGQASKIDTRSFFPQIDETVHTPYRTPQNPSFQFFPRAGTPNNLTSGGVGGDTVNDRTSKFPGILFNGSYPADPQIAVGPNAIVQVVNTSIAFFNKAGTKTFQKDLGPSGFWSGMNATPFTFDPKVFYDPNSKRFFVVTLEQDDNSQTSHFLIGVSDDSDPSGTWLRYRVDNSAVDGSDKYWLDYEGWGFNKDAVVATGNMFPFANGNVFVQAFVFKKTDLTSGTGGTVSIFKDTETFTIKVAKMDDNVSPFVFGTSLDTTSQIRVYAWRNLTSGTPEMVFSKVTVPQFSTIGRPPSTGGAVLDSLSGRVVDATYRTGSLLTCHTTKAPGSPNRSQVTWYEVKPGAWPTSGKPTLAQTGNVSFSNDAWAYLPGINKNKFGDISVIFTRSSSSISADIMVASRKATDPAGFMGNPTQMAASSGSTVLIGRWGDYTTVCVDPTDGYTFWGNHMVITSNRFWGTQIVSWKVSTSGGSGGNGGIQPNSVSVLEGTYSAGSLASIQTPNGQYYDTNTSKKGDGSFATAIQTTYSVVSNRASVADIEVNVKGLVTPARSPVGFIFLWNYNTSKWDFFKSYTLSGLNQVYTAKAIGTGSRYVSDSKQVKVLFRALDPVRNNGVPPAPFQLKTDSVQIFLTTK